MTKGGQAIRFLVERELFSFGASTAYMIRAMIGSNCTALAKTWRICPTCGHPLGDGPLKHCRDHQNERLKLQKRCSATGSLVCLCCFDLVCHVAPVHLCLVRIIFFGLVHVMKKACQTPSCRLSHSSGKILRQGFAPRTRILKRLPLQATVFDCELAE